MKPQKVSKPGERYTEQELMVRLKLFIGICLALTLIGIVFVVLYSIIFVTQPLNAMSPIDQKFLELIIAIATFLTGSLSCMMLAGGNKEAQEMALKAANKGWDNKLTQTPPARPAIGGMPPRPMPGAVGMPSMPPRPSAPTVMSEMGVELEDGDPPVRNTRND